MQVYLKITFCFLFYIKIMKCCDCNLEEMIKDTVIKSASNVIEKRQMHDDENDDNNQDDDNGEEDSAKVLHDSETTEGTTTIPTDETNRVKKVFLKTAEHTKKGIESDQNDECLFYKQMPKFNFEKMEDVWKIAFYKTAEKLSCFKIHIKKTTVENRKMWHEMYGDFNGTINWRNCQFEVASSTLKNGRSEQKHFLEGSKKDRGVFKNVILTRILNGDIVTLLEQSPDQWLVISNLLLMRDCDNGDVVVFSRLPMEPSLRDIEDALTIFGEDAINGILACETLRNPKYQTLS